MAVRIHYFKSDPPNFGDELNVLVWPALIPELRATDQDIVLVGIGSILDDTVPADGPVVVLGTGAGLAPLPSGLHDGSIRVLALRGPLTAALAGLPRDLAITDSAILLRAIYPGLVRTRESRGKGPILFMPHFSTVNDAGWQRACARAGIEMVDPRDPCKAVLRKIASARLVIAEAMHGAIVADAFGVPWVPVASTRHFSTFKWVDWALSLSVPFKPLILPAVSIRHACKRAWLGMMADRLLAEEMNLEAVDHRDPFPPAVVRLLEETRRRLAMPAKPIGMRIRLKAAALYNRVVDPLAGWAGERVLASVNERLEIKVADVLLKAVATGGYRSDDEISAKRLMALQKKVRAFRESLRGTAARVAVV